RSPRPMEKADPRHEGGFGTVSGDERMRKPPLGGRPLLASLLTAILPCSSVGQVTDLPTARHVSELPHCRIPTAPTPAALTLGDLEQLALQNNPTLAQAALNVEAARGRALQSGLYPNPTVGYNGEQMGQRGKAALGEQQGLFIDQTFVTAGKLKLNRARYGQEVSQMEAQAQAQQYRVLNGVRVRFYQLLAMQRLLDVQADLLKVAQNAVETTEELVNVGAANKADLLQARIEERQERVALENARSQYWAAWQQL